MIVSIVIPTRNRARKVIRLLEQVERQIQRCRETVEVIVVDHASEPRHRAALDAWKEHMKGFGLKILAAPGHLAVGGVRNLGLRAARGDIILFLDDDCMPGDNHIQDMIHWHAEHPEALMINGALRPLRDHYYARHWYHHYAHAFCRSTKRFHPVYRISPGNMSIKRALLDVFPELFDPNLTSREDFDLMIRMRKRNIDIYMAHGALAYVEARRHFIGFMRQRWWYRKGQQALLAKHGPEAIDAAEALVPPPPRAWLFTPLYLAQYLMGIWMDLFSPSPHN